MTTKTISTYVSGGYTLASQYSVLDITTAGGVGGTGVALGHASILDNYGRIHAAGGSNGVTATAAVTITNGSVSDTTASIYGYSGIFAPDAAATVSNFGSIQSSARYGDGVFLVDGGLVTNGSSKDGYAIIYADNSGVSAAAVATVVNFGSINGYYASGVYLKDGGSVTNGSASDRSAVIFSHDGSGVVDPTDTARLVNFGSIFGVFGDGILVGGGGVVTNGSAKDTTALIAGQTAVAASQAPETVKNFGTINGYGSGASDAGVYLADGGSVTNTGAKATINGIGLGVFSVYGPTVVTNAGTIWSSLQAAVYLEGDGLPATQSVTNGSATDKTALIEGAGGVGFGRSGTVVNFGTILATSTAADFYGVYVRDRGNITNGSISDTTATIRAQAGGVLTRGFVANFGVISGGGGEGVLLLGGSVSNGATGDATASISGVNGVVVGYYALNATVTNFGTITGTGGTAVDFGDASQVLVVEAGSAFVGAVNGDGGTLALDSGNGVLTGLLAGSDVTVSGSMAATTFTDFNTVEIGVAANFATSGAVSLAAGRSIIVSGSLTLGTSKVKVTNAGLIETLGGTVTVNGVVTGAGQAAINGGALDFLSTFDQAVAFTGATGVLELAQSQSYAASISGFSKTGGTSLDLGDITFGGSTKATYSGTAASGTLTVTDGTHTAHIHLSGDYRASTFTVASDGHGGTVVHDPAKAPAPPLGAPAPHQLIAAMAAIGAGGGGYAVGGAFTPHAPAPMLARPAQA